MVATEVAEQQFTISDLTPGATYRFKVAAHNAIGYGSYSAEFVIIAATNPDQPTPPVTSFDGENVVITWQAPFNGGSAITAYTVKVRQVDEVTLTEPGTYCDGTTQTVINTRTCTIPVHVVTSSPYNLAWGQSVWATVTAHNIIGSSEMSDAGNGSVILVVPDAPINLQNLPRVTTAYQIGLSWELGAN